jgi:hypothetical protein
LIVTLVFILGKAVFRPFVVNQGYGGFLEILAFSLPNLCEAIVWTILVFFILLFTNDALLERKSEFAQSLFTVRLLAVILAGIYVILQEFKIHNLGGVNIYDPYDVLFSVLGLVFGAILLFRVNPEITESVPA